LGFDEVQAGAREPGMPEGSRRVAGETGNGAKRRRDRHGLDPDATHEIAEVFSGGPLLDFFPSGGAIDAEFGERADEDSVLVDRGVPTKLVGQSDSPLFIECEGQRGGKEPGKSILGIAIGQRLRGGLLVELLHFSGRQHGDITIRVRRRQEGIALGVRRPPGRRNRQAILIVEAVPKKAGVERFAELSHGKGGICPTVHHFNPFHPLPVKKTPLSALSFYDKVIHREYCPDCWRSEKTLSFPIAK
jgi:hypothetical protein